MSRADRPVAGAILAGGQSRRMGFNKAFIKAGGVPLIERTARVMRSVFPSPFIVANDTILYEKTGLPVYSDIIKGAGSLGGIYTALMHSAEPEVFVIACDMPYLDEACIRAVLERAGKADCVAPFIGGRLHPLHALYSKRCLPEIEAMIRDGNLRIGCLMERVNVKRLTEDAFRGLPIESSVENVNTKDDLSRTGLDG